MKPIDGRESTTLSHQQTRMRHMLKKGSPVLRSGKTIIAQTTSEFVEHGQSKLLKRVENAE